MILFSYLKPSGCGSQTLWERHTSGILQWGAGTEDEISVQYPCAQMCRQGWADLTTASSGRSWRGGTNPISQPVLFANPFSHRSNPIPTAAFRKKSHSCMYQLFRFISPKLRLLSRTQQRSRNLRGFSKLFWKMIWSFYTALKLAKSELIAIKALSSYHFTQFLSFLPARNLPHDLLAFLLHCWHGACTVVSRALSTFPS